METPSAAQHVIVLLIQFILENICVKALQTRAGSTIQSDNDLIEHITETFIIETE